MEKKVVILGWFIINAILFSGCQQVLNTPVGTGEAGGYQAAASENVDRFEITATDCDTAAESAVNISLYEPEGGIEGVYSWENGSLRITSAGEYVLNGSLDDGNLVINVFNDENVHLILNDVNINADGKPAIVVEKANKVVITAVEGTENTISDSFHYESDQKACIISDTDLTFNGSGKLSVYGYHGDAIRSKDLVKVIAANVNIRSEGDGIRGNDGVILFESVTEIESEGTGIYSDSEKDMVMIYGGSCKVIAGDNAVSANQHVSISGCATEMNSVLQIVKCSGVRDIEEDYLK